MSDPKPATSSSTPSNVIGNVGPTSLDCSKATNGVWLVKVKNIFIKSFFLNLFS